MSSSLKEYMLNKLVLLASVYTWIAFTGYIALAPAFNVNL